MEVKINKEIRDYQENIYFGLNLRQFICSILGIVASILLYFLFKKHLNTEILSWVCMLGACPFILAGFVKYNGLTAEKFVLAYIKSKILMPVNLTFKPTNLYYEIIKSKKEIKENENIKKEK